STPAAAGRASASAQPAALLGVWITAMSHRIQPAVSAISANDSRLCEAIRMARLAADSAKNRHVPVRISRVKAHKTIGPSPMANASGMAPRVIGSVRAIYGAVAYTAALTAAGSGPHC